MIPVNFDHRARAERDRLESAGPIIQSVTWLQAPSFADVAAAYPARAGGVEGSSTIFCRFGAEGRLSRC